MKKQIKNVLFLPKSTLGKLSMWVVLIALVILYSQYWIMLGLLGNLSGDLLILQIIFSWVMIFWLCICGVTSIISIIKYHDYSIFLCLTALIGTLGILFLIGELLLPH